MRGENVLVAVPYKSNNDSKIVCFSSCLFFLSFSVFQPLIFAKINQSLRNLNMLLRYTKLYFQFKNCHFIVISFFFFFHRQVKNFNIRVMCAKHEKS